MHYDFSVIIPYYNKPYEINLILKSLSLQDYDLDRFEVVIIDDGSEKKLFNTVKKYKNSLNINYQNIVHIGNRSYIRNAGAKHSRGERLIFIDCDMVPAKNFISSFNSEINKNHNIISLGWRTNLFEFENNFINETVIEENFDLFTSLPGQYDERTQALLFEESSGLKLHGYWQFFYSHSFCICHDTYINSGGFDEEFGKNWGAEDIELGYRLFNSGCSFVINKNANCYHIEHSVDLIKQIDSLKKNYKILLRKHPDWHIELYTREFQTWIIEHIEIQEKITSKEHLLTLENNLDSVLKLIPFNTLLVGIDSKLLIKSDKVNCAFIPESNIKSPKISPIIGIETELADNHFDLALVSNNYKKLNYGLFTMLLNETNRISKKVIIIDESHKLELAPYLIKKHSKHKNDTCVLFSLNNEIHYSFTKYYFLNLAIAARKIGIKTGVQLLLDVEDDIGLNSGYLRFNNKNKISSINAMKKHDLNFIGDQIPCIMDTYDSQYISRSLPKRILWEEFIAENQIARNKNDILFSYNKVFVKRLWEEKYYKGIKNTAYLPVGIDVEKINLIKTHKKEPNNIFTFLWTDRFTNKESNLSMLLETFNEVFGENMDVQLKIIIPGNFIPINYKDASFVTPSFFNEYRTLIETYRFIYNRNLDELQCKYSSNKNIIFITGVYDDEVYSNELYLADCLIHLNANLEIFPLVLESIAFGKKPIIPKDNRYDGYITDEMCLYVETDKIARHLLDDVVNICDETKYLSVNIPKRDSLKQILYYAYKNKLCIDKKLTDTFKKDFSWKTIAQKLNILLKDFD